MKYLRLITNWLLLITAPVWLGIGFIIVVIYGLIKQGIARDRLITGEKWFFE